MTGTMSISTTRCLPTHPDRSIWVTWAHYDEGYTSTVSLQDVDEKPLPAGTHCY